MKKVLFCFSLLILSIVFSVANASEIAVVNLDEILKNSTAVNNLTKSLEAKKVTIEKKIKSDEEKLKKEQADLESKFQALSDDAKQKKMVEFQNKIMEFQKNVKENESSLQSDYMDGIGQVTEEIQKIIAEMKNDKSGKYSFDIVLPNASAVYSDSKLDISAEVLARLNKNLKQIKTRK